MTHTLKSNLEEWTDFDVAGVQLGISLGIFQPNTHLTEVKHIFWSNNPLGVLLMNFFEELVESNMLQKDEENVRYRWNPDWGNFGENLINRGEWNSADWNFKGDSSPPAQTF